MTRRALPALAAGSTLLAALCLGPVFATSAWFPPAALAVLAVALAGAGARRLPLPPPLVPLAGASALLACLVGLFAPGEAAYRLLPTLEALRRLALLAGQAQQEILTQAAPVSPSPALLLTATAGVGLVALLVDTLAVTLRRPALAGLPLVALYAVPAAVVPGGVPWLWFALAAAGYLALLLVEAQEKVGRWGWALPGSGDSAGGSGALGALSRRIGSGAIAAAVVVPVAVPGVGEGVLGNGSGGGGSANRTVMVVNPVLSLKEDLHRPDDRELLTYRTDDESPGYLRVVGLDVFRGDQWEPSRLQVPQDQSVDRGLGTPLGLADGVRRQQRRTTVAVRDLETQWLPLPFPAARVEIEDTWLYDRETYNVFSTSVSTRDQEYVVEHLEVEPDPAQLRAAPAPPAPLLARFTALPAGIDASSRVAATARAVTQRAGTPYDKALALQTWLRRDGGFRYDETAPDGTGTAAVQSFLERKRGFCVHFASAMTVMARQLGIPARMAVGFLPGERTAGGEWSVTVHDAHTWPELYFEGVGWVPFEPTPADRAQQVPGYAVPPAPATRARTPSASPSSSSPSRSAESSPNAINPRLLEQQAQADRQQSSAAATEEDGAAPLPWRTSGAGLLVLLLAGAPAGARLLVRRRRWQRADTPTAAAEAAWAQLREDAVDHGLRWSESETPRQLARRWTGELALAAPARSALHRVVEAVERSRYGGAPARSADLPGAGTLHADARALRAGIATVVGRRDQLRAQVLPASSVSRAAAVLHRGSEQVAGLGQRVGRLPAALRGRTSPR